MKDNQEPEIPTAVFGLSENCKVLEKSPKKNI